MSLLKVENLCVDLDEFRLQDISFSLDPGDYLTIMGPTGAGKTIFLEAIVGFWPSVRGCIILEDQNITHELPENRHIGIVYQDYALMPHMTVNQNIAYSQKKCRHPNRGKTVRELAESLGIDHLLHRKPATLSGGEQQRVALARALIANPKLLLLDEPFSALDRRTRRQARIFLREAVRERGTTVVHITHDIDDTWAFANKLAVFNDGRILQFGTIQDVFARPQAQFVADLVGASLFKGTVISCENGQSEIDLGGMCLKSKDTAIVGNRVNVAIRHEMIRLEKKPPAQFNGYNVMKAVLNHMVPEGSALLIDLSVNGTRMHALVSANGEKRLDVRQGERLYALIDKEHVRIV